MLMVCHHLNPSDPGGPGLRRVADPAHHDGRRGRAARPRRDLDDRLGLAGHGPDRRDDHPDLADGARDEAAPRRAARRRRRRQRADNCGPAATWPSTRSARRSRTGSTPRSARWSRASWPTWCCGSRPSSASGRTLVLKAGVIAWANMGDANASIPTPQPQLPRPMFGAFGAMPARLGLHFVSPAALEAGLADRLGQRAAPGRGHGRVGPVQGRPAGERRAARGSTWTARRSRCASTAS